MCICELEFIALPTRPPPFTFDNTFVICNSTFVFVRNSKCSFHQLLKNQPKVFRHRSQFQLLRGLPDLKGSAGACDMVMNKGAFRLGLKMNRFAIH